MKILLLLLALQSSTSSLFSNTENYFQLDLNYNYLEEPITPVDSKIWLFDTCGKDLRNVSRDINTTNYYACGMNLNSKQNFNNSNLFGFNLYMCNENDWNINYSLTELNSTN